MDQYYVPTVFFTLFFVVDPLGLIPVFLTYLSGLNNRTRVKIIFQSILISIIVSQFFILLGKYLLIFLGISSGAFLVAGGILLFLISIEMLFGRPSRIRMLDSEHAAMEDAGISVFPLAIPMLCGPGNIAALLMFSSNAWGDWTRIGVLMGLSTAVFLIAFVIMFFSSAFEKILGHLGISILQRLIGLILSAMSVQFIKNGLVTMGFIK